MLSQWFTTKSNDTTNAQKAEGIPSGCPVKHSSFTSEKSSEQIQGCPVKHGKANINPLNQMPTDLSSAQGTESSILGKERTISSIPRENPEEKWVYPSEQQFYNALKRKNFETDEKDISMIVTIHNELNEQCWNEIKRWELFNAENSDPKLLRFMGRPSEPTPKARILNFLGYTHLPFDRHDWVVDRNGKEVRYVIDYYEAPHKPGEAAFSIDARPAIDSPSAIYERFKMWMNSE
jgi:cytochrome c heme-lyase